MGLISLLTSISPRVALGIPSCDIDIRPSGFAIDRPVPGRFTSVSCNAGSIGAPVVGAEGTDGGGATGESPCRATRGSEMKLLSFGELIGS